MSNTLYDIFKHPCLKETSELLEDFDIKDSDIFWRKIKDSDRGRKKFFNRPTLAKFREKYGLNKLFTVCQINAISEQELLRSFLDSDREYQTLPRILRNKLFLMIKS